MAEAIKNPILNSPYKEPTRYHEIGNKGATGKIIEGRRPSESFIPIPKARKGKEKTGDVFSEISLFENDATTRTGERAEKHELVDSLRRNVSRWRAYGYEGATATSRDLLEYWSDPEKENKLFFCQREAVETAIFLAEVAGRKYGYPNWLKKLAPVNDEYNAGLPRLALKMATGAGKTVVMAMLIAWQTLNKVQNPRDKRFSKRFLIVAPGVTIRDRLRVLEPAAPDNYYDARSVVPPKLRSLLNQAEVIVTNYHSFLPRDRREFQGVATGTKQILEAGLPAGEAQFQETEAEVVARVLRKFSGKKEIIVINDEAHHCYLNKIVTRSELDTLEDGALQTKKEIDAANEDARVWFKGLQAVHKELKIKTIYDLSATPFYLNGSGYNEGFLFPWVVSDFSLMDAIECGIVKVPRMPIDDNALHDSVTYLNLWDNIEPPLPKTNRAKINSIKDWQMPDVLEGALFSLYRSYENAYKRWEDTLKNLGEAPPVLIVVCPNTLVSKLVYQWIAGAETNPEAGEDIFYDYAGNLALFKNSENGIPLPIPHTILVDSKSLEADSPLPKDFSVAARAEIEAFKAEYKQRNPGANISEIDDKTILREVLNTVGKPGKLGSGIRCVISVSMLTEGWDANTVSHILGVRAFRSQLLCEQVVGRGLRRRSYVTDENGMFPVEEAEIYGVPFAFIPTETTIDPPGPPQPTQEVYAIKERNNLRIDFPVLTGYRMEDPDPELQLDPDKTKAFVVRVDDVPTEVVVSDILGRDEEQTFATEYRDQTLCYELAKLTLDTYYRDEQGGSRYWLMPQLIRLAKEWITKCVVYRDNTTPSHLCISSGKMREAAEFFHSAIAQQSINKSREFVLPIFSKITPVLSTDGVYFLTRKKTIDTFKSHISHVVLDGKNGNTWEQQTAEVLELAHHVHSYVKNDHLGFTIPYIFKGRSHDYIPDFLVQLEDKGDGIKRTLIIEVSGSQKSPGPTKMKAQTAEYKWCAAVNNSGKHGIWQYLEITTMLDVDSVIREAITKLWNTLGPSGLTGKQGA